GTSRKNLTVMKSSIGEGVYLGIDIGGTGIKGGLVASNGELLRECSVRTPVEEGRDGIQHELEQLAATLITEWDMQVLAVGVGSTGSSDPHTCQVVFPTNNLPGWTGHPLAVSLSELLELLVFADNDVNVAALGEAWLGGAMHYDTFVLA